MANPQPEFHTRFSNELLAAFIGIIPSLPRECIAVWLSIFRKTYGYHKKEDWISLGQLSKMTGLRRAHVARAVKRLLDENMITKDCDYKLILGIQKDYEQWGCYQQREHLIGESVTSGENRGVTNGGNICPESVPNGGNHKRNEYKRKDTKERRRPFINNRLRATTKW